jgi:hypothetical protein
VLKTFADQETPNVQVTLENLALAVDALEQHRKMLVR